MAKRVIVENMKCLNIAGFFKDQNGLLHEGARSSRLLLNDEFKLPGFLIVGSHGKKV